MELIFSKHFIEDVLPDRPYLTRERIERVLLHPIKREEQKDSAIRHWGYIPEMGKCLRIVTASDRRTIITGIIDSQFTQKYLETPRGVRR